MEFIIQGRDSRIDLCFVFGNVVKADDERGQINLIMLEDASRLQDCILTIIDETDTKKKKANI